MNYQKLTKEQLIRRVEAQDRLLEQLLKELNQEARLDFGWSGNLGHWYWDLPTNVVTFNPLKVRALGYRIEDIPQPIGYDFFTSKLHPDDYDRVMENMRHHLRGESHVYEVEYRILDQRGIYKWFYDRGTITKRDETGRPLLLSGIVFDISERKEIESRLESEKRELLQHATTDDMTKALNYRGIIGALKQMLAQSEETTLSVLMIDIDDFKRINDKYGHLIGDEILKELVFVIQSNLRDTDLLGRYGGEEFLVVFPNTSLDMARAIADRLRENVSDHHFIKDIHITVSGGVYELVGASIHDLIHQADINLYEAKRRGKNIII